MESQSPLLNPQHQRRTAPHIVVPTVRSFRESVLSRTTTLASEPPAQPSEDDRNPSGGLYYGAVDDDIDGGRGSLEGVDGGPGPRTARVSRDAAPPDPRRPLLYEQWRCLERAASQVPAVALVALFHLMVGIPFGVSYFPVGWKSPSAASSAAPGGGGDVADEAGGGFALDGAFPLPGKQALGIRMFLFSTVVGQLAMTYASNFHNCIALQMVENVPFCQALTYIVVEIQGYGKDALSTLFFLFGLSSVIVGLVFYFLGRMKLGKIFYFFPTHVLVGCIGGIGVFIARTGLEVTADTSLSLSAAGWKSFLEKFHLLVVVFAFEAGLRLISHWTKDEQGQARYPLLAPIYFILITPMFYLGYWILSRDGDDREYFFPPIAECSDDECTGGTSSVWEIFHLLDLSKVSWTAVIRSIPTMIALVIFSLIHVPINIPAFAVSTNVDVDMNVELTAHGYSNGIVGIFGGVQNYMAYTQSMIYYKSGGNGKASSFAVALFTTVLFFVGPSIAIYMPRCMAGTLLLHCGIDLFLEGVYDSYGQYDYLEYAGIWAIVFVMTFAGMESALLAGAISALLTYAIQSVAYPKPIRGSMTAATLRSSDWNRSPLSYEILDSDITGRIRVRVVQFQGHLFFGNVSLFSDGVKNLIRNSPLDQSPYIIIIDFTLVLGIDSSAAQAIMKLRDSFTNQFGIKLSIFVPGKADGFPCEVNLSDELNSLSNPSHDHTTKNGSHANDRLLAKFTGSLVCDDLDQALVYAEDALIAMVDPNLLYDDAKRSFLGTGNEQIKTLKEEKIHAIDFLHRRCPGEKRELVEQFFLHFRRETYNRGDVLWKQGAKSDSVKLLISGDLISQLENEAGTTETISIGSVVGESGLVESHNRNSTVHVLADDTVLYSLSRESWEEMKEKEPKVAHVLYAIVVRYLTLRVQHVSNRIFETRCLPI